jgi:hypothetical protein
LEAAPEQPRRHGACRATARTLESARATARLVVDRRRPFFLRSCEIGIDDRHVIPYLSPPPSQLASMPNRRRCARQADRDEVVVGSAFATCSGEPRAKAETGIEGSNPSIAIPRCSQVRSKALGPDPSNPISLLS